MQVEIVVMESRKEIARITGKIDSNLTDADIEKLILAEALLEKATGYRFHINQLI